MNKSVEAVLVNIANLFKTKTIISFTVIFALTYGFVKQFVPIEVYAPLATAIVTYFFRKDKDE